MTESEYQAIAEQGATIVDCGAYHSSTPDLYTTQPNPNLWNQVYMDMYMNEYPEISAESNTEKYPSPTVIQAYCNGHILTRSANPIKDLTKSDVISLNGIIADMYQKVKTEINLRRKNNMYSSLEYSESDLTLDTDTYYRSQSLIDEDVLNTLDKYVNIYCQEVTSQINIKSQTIAQLGNANMTSQGVNTVISHVNTFLNECICYSDCNYYSVCWCYSYCNFY